MRWANNQSQIAKQVLVKDYFGPRPFSHCMQLPPKTLLLMKPDTLGLPQHRFKPQFATELAAGLIQSHTERDTLLHFWCKIPATPSFIWCSTEQSLQKHPRTSRSCPLLCFEEWHYVYSGLYTGMTLLCFKHPDCICSGLNCTGS